MTTTIYAANIRCECGKAKVRPQSRASNDTSAIRRASEGDGDPEFLAKIDRLMGRTTVTLPQPLSTVRAPSVPTHIADAVQALGESVDKMLREVTELHVAAEVARHPDVVASVNELGEVETVVVAPKPYWIGGNSSEDVARLRLRATELTAKLAGAKANARIADAQRIEAELAEVRQQLGEAEFPRDEQRRRERGRGGDDVPRYAVEIDPRNGATKRRVN